MRILITGANGYIGRRLMSALRQQGHDLICCVRDKWRFEQETTDGKLQVMEVNFLETAKSTPFPTDIDVAFFLVHSMKEGAAFEATEKKVAEGFMNLLTPTRCRQLIYLSGIVNETTLSPHLSSRLAVEKILRSGNIPCTVLRAGIIVGSGSSSFEIIRDLVEKLPVMITPKWVETKCQPIAIRNVIEFLSGVMLKPAYYNNDFDIGGPEILTYKQMMLQFAQARQLKRTIITVPVNDTQALQLLAVFCYRHLLFAGKKPGRQYESKRGLQAQSASQRDRNCINDLPGSGGDGLSEN